MLIYWHGTVQVPWHLRSLIILFQYLARKFSSFRFLTVSSTVKMQMLRFCTLARQIIYVQSGESWESITITGRALGILHPLCNAHNHIQKREHPQRKYGATEQRASASISLLISSAKRGPLSSRAWEAQTVFTPKTNTNLEVPMMDYYSHTLSVCIASTSDSLASQALKCGLLRGICARGVSNEFTEYWNLVPWRSKVLTRLQNLLAL